MQESIDIFISYAQEDERYLKELIKHLHNWERQGIISVWHDRNIDAGTEWLGEIDKYLDIAQIILLLISADFLASDYCNSVEVQRAMEKHEAGEAVVIPIILRPVYWQDTPFAELQALPRNGTAVTSDTWPSLDDALVNVLRGIRAVIADFSITSSIQRKTQALFDKTIPIDNNTSPDKVRERLSRGKIPGGKNAFPSIWSVPFQRNRGFTGREEVLASLHKTLRMDGNATLTQPYALSGLGGIV